MTFEQAISDLKENAAGANEYETITTWREIEDAALNEIAWLSDRIRQLESVAARAMTFGE